jgi:hypothetical protein
MIIFVQATGHGMHMYAKFGDFNVCTLLSINDLRFDL